MKVLWKSARARGCSGFSLAGLLLGKENPASICKVSGEEWYIHENFLQVFLVPS